MRPSIRLTLVALFALSIPVLTPVPVRAQQPIRLQIPPFAGETLRVVRPAPRLETPFRVAAPSTPRAPQAAAPRGSRYGWDFEFHTGAAWTHAIPGAATMPEPGSGFLTFSGLQSRFVRSWYFGDGSAMINANMSTGGLTGRITPLDPVLNGESVKSSSFSPFGVRVARSLTSRFGAEFAFELMGGLTLTDSTRTAAETTRASFETVFNSRFSAFNSRSVSSALTMTDGGAQMLATGALTFNLRQGGRWVPYIVGGGGAAFATGDDATIDLAGDYSFVSGSNTPYRQTDSLSVKYQAGSAAVFFAGGGLKWYLNNRSGIQADFRMHFMGDPVSVTVNWNPATIPGTPTNTIAFFGTPALQISTSNPSLSSLSLKQTEPDLVVSSGGKRQTMNFTVGYFYRFPTAAPAPRRTTAAAAPAMWDSKRKWEVDGHGGAFFGALSTSGTGGGAFPAGQAFTAASGQPSRYISSWMFGDGAVLINQIASAFAGIPVVDRMASLNPLLSASSLEGSSGGSFGARVSRRLNSRFRAEFEIESSATSLAFTSSSLNRIEATRASFAPVWNGLIATGGGVIFTSPNVSATTVLSDDVSSWRTSMTGNLEIRLWQTPRMIVFATGGGGVIRQSASLPEATVTGTYQFLYAGTVPQAPLSETDTVRVHYQVSQYTPVVTFGGGMKYFLSARSGIRADLRVYASGNSLDTLVDATPSNVVGSPTFSISSTTNPALVFSNSPSLRGNLTGPVITNLKTFTGSGQQVQYSITAGYFFRF